jgi:predicted SnoaL-like aldol condensation-catalyzing enzyme
MSTITPVDVVHRYFDELYGLRRLELVPELLADPVLRHYPGGTRTLSIDDSADRLESGFATYPTMRFDWAVSVAAGEYVTVAWNGVVATADSAEQRQASIEIFRVVDGLISEVWIAQETEGLWS